MPDVTQEQTQKHNLHTLFRSHYIYVLIPLRYALFGLSFNIRCNAPNTGGQRGPGRLATAARRLLCRQWKRKPALSRNTTNAISSILHSELGELDS